MGKENLSDQNMAEEEESIQSPAVCPLDIPHVLEKVMGVLDLTSLGSARSTCRQWRSASNAAFGRRSVLNLFSLRKQQLQDLVDHANGPSGFWFDLKNVVVNFDDEKLRENEGDGDGDRITTSQISKEQLVRNVIDSVLLETVSEKIVSFSICGWKMSEEILNLSLLTDLLRGMINLRTLTLGPCIPERITRSTGLSGPDGSAVVVPCLAELRLDGRNSYSSDFIVSIFRAAPVLSSVQVSPAPARTVQALFSAFRACKPDKIRCLELEELEELVPSEIENIRHSCLKLKELVITVRGAGFSVDELLCPLLETMAKTLEIVVIPGCGALGTFRQFRSFPRMPLMSQLKSVTIQSTKPYEAIRVMAFLNSMPALERLKIERVGGEEGECQESCLAVSRDGVDCFNGISENRHIVRLIFPTRIGGIPRKDGFVLLLQNFVNLCHLEIQLDDELLRVIFESELRLRKLVILGTSCVGDNGITGLCFHTSLKKEYGRVFNRVVEQNIYLGITRMESLTSLSIDGNYGHVSDLSISHGLLYLPSLRHVTLQNTLVRSGGITALRKKGVEVHVKRDNLYWSIKNVSF